MSYTMTAGPMAGTAKIPPRDRLRRASDHPAIRPLDAAVFERLAQRGSTAGLSSRHDRQRAADASAVVEPVTATAPAGSAPAMSAPSVSAPAVSAPAATPPADFWLLRDLVPTLDQGTPELRRRIDRAQAATPRMRASWTPASGMRVLGMRVPVALAWSVAGGASLLLWLGLGGALIALWQLISPLV
jgi:hypothetical protein